MDFAKLIEKRLSTSPESRLSYYRIMHESYSRAVKNDDNNAVKLSKDDIYCLFVLPNGNITSVETFEWMKKYLVAVFEELADRGVVSYSAIEFIKSLKYEDVARRVESYSMYRSSEEMCETIRRITVSSGISKRFNIESVQAAAILAWNGFSIPAIADMKTSDIDIKNQTVKGIQLSQHDIVVLLTNSALNRSRFYGDSDLLIRGGYGSGGYDATKNLLRRFNNIAYKYHKGLYTPVLKVCGEFNKLYDIEQTKAITYNIIKSVVNVSSNYAARRKIILYRVWKEKYNLPSYPYTIKATDNIVT